MVYYDLTNGNLKYAKKSGGIWTRETADGSVNDVGRYGSVALDAQGNPHVSYRDDTSGDLKYARRMSGVWATEVVDGTVDNVGQYTGIAIDATGVVNISYYDLTNGNLKYARKAAGAWTIDVADGAAGNVGLWTAIALDSQGNPSISYQDNVTNDLMYAVKSSGAWTRVAIDAGPNQAALYTSIAFDTQDNPHVSYYDNTTGDLRYAQAGVRVVAPASAATWAVGSLQTVSWSGVGPVDVLLSLDGGRSFNPLVQSVSDNAISLRVPHTPTRFGRIRILRTSPFSSSDTDSFFQIDATIALMKFDATVVDRGGSSPETGGVLLSWESAPEPPTIAGYRVERESETGAGLYVPLHSGLLTEKTLMDPSAGLEARYRLIAANGLGEETLLGETAVAPGLAAGRALVAYPNPAVGGRTSVLFRVPFDPREGASTMPARLDVYDASGRLVRRLASGTYATGLQSAAWDGNDVNGRPVGPGTYFMRMTAGSSFSASERVIVVR